MSCADAARDKVRECADTLMKEARRIGILRSMEATEASRWLDGIAEKMRAACDESPAEVTDERSVRRSKKPTSRDDHKVKRRAPRAKAKASPGPSR